MSFSVHEITFVLLFTKFNIILDVASSYSSSYGALSMCLQCSQSIRPTHVGSYIKLSQLKYAFIKTGLKKHI